MNLIFFCNFYFLGFLYEVKKERRMWRPYPSVRQFVRRCVLCARACVCVRATWCQRLNCLSDWHGIRSKGSFQNSVEQERISYKSAPWLPYFTYGPQWVSTLLSTYSDLICMKFSSNFHVNPLTSFECHENRYNESYMLLRGVSEVLPCLLIFCSNLGNIRHRMFPQKFELFWLSWKLAHWRPYHLDEVKNQGSVQKAVQNLHVSWKAVLWE
jgi:hypothetical protein